MRKSIIFSMAIGLMLSVGRPAVAGPSCASENGDTNGDGGKDLSDAVYMLAFLFQGGPSTVPFCVAPGTGEGCAEENGDTNGDGGNDLSDVIYLLAFLFQGGPGPVASCVVTVICEGDPSDLPATGRTGCKGEDGIPIVCTSAACLGQDGFYLAGCPNDASRFSDNSDGTVTDTCTGLMWQQDTADLSGDGSVTGDVFPAGDRSTRCEALAHFDGLSFAGQDDWRLPNIRELQSLFDYARKQPAIDPVFESTSSFYWSSTTLADDSGWPWVGYFHEGGVGAPNPDHGDNRGYVRPVRAGGCQLPDTGQTLCYDETGAATDCASDECPGQDGSSAIGCPGVGRFADNSDGTVTDSCTGLVWQKVTGNGGAVLPWCGALDYCEGLTLGAVDDWRLPNIRELQSLADYGRLDPAIDPTFSAESGAYWSSTSVESGQDSRAWIVEFGPLPGNPPGAVVEYDTDSHVRAVRGGQITPPETNCVDNVDNDMDGDTDCADADCAAHPTCPPPPETNCNNNVDDDSDGSTDCDDCDCVGTPSCPAAPSDLPHTGQTVCKDELGDPTSCTSGECPGQDGLYLAGCTLTGAARYVDNGDGTVVDNCTGLMWHQDTADISGDGAITGDPFPTGDRALWRDVLAYSEDLTFAGHEDWRLPNIRELQSIIDYGNHSPAIDTDFFVDTVQNKVWSSTLQAGPPGIDPRRVWFVWSKEGGVGGNRAHRDIAYVRPVRSGGCLLPETGQTLCYDDSDPPIKLDSCPGAGDFAGQDGFYTTGCPTAGRFSDNGDGTVSDACTGLLWQKADDGNTRTWCNALDYCETLSLAGFNDWRLPNLRELQSIIDYSNRDPAIDGSFDVTTGRRWSSTPLADSAGAPNRAWIVSFGGTEDASWFESDMASTYFVLAVREP